MDSDLDVGHLAAPCILLVAVPLQQDLVIM